MRNIFRVCPLKISRSLQSLSAKGHLTLALKVTWPLAWRTRDPWHEGHVTLAPKVTWPSKRPLPSALKQIQVHKSPQVRIWFLEDLSPRKSIVMRPPITSGCDHLSHRDVTTFHIRVRLPFTSRALWWQNGCAPWRIPSRQEDGSIHFLLNLPYFSIRHHIRT